MTVIKLHVAKRDDASAVSALFARSYSTFLVNDYAPEILERAMPFLTFAKPELLTSGTYYIARTDAGEVVGAGDWTVVRPCSTFRG